MRPFVQGSQTEPTSADHAPKPDVAGGGVDRLGLPSSWAVAQAVAGGAEMRPAFDDAARDVIAWTADVVAGIGRLDARIGSGSAAGAGGWIGSGAAR